MAYQATGTYNDASMSESDKALIEEYKKMYNTAAAAGDTAGMNAAHAAAEGVRANYGYSGGSDGSNYIEVSKPKSENDYDLSKYLENQSKANIEADLANLKYAYNKNMASYNKQIKELPQNYESARNQAAAQNAIEQRAFAERANATGLNSGTSGQAELARSSVYQGTLAGINKEQANALSDLEYAKSGLQAEYENAIAQAKATGNSALATALYQEMIRTQELVREDEQLANAYAKEDENTKRQQQEEKAATLASFGDFSGYAALGYTPEEIQTMENAYKQALSAQSQTSSAKNVSRTGGNNYKKATKNSLFADAIAYAKKYGGSTSLAEDYVRANYKNYGYSSQTQALSALNLYVAEQNQLQTDYQNAIAGAMTQTEFMRHKNSSSNNIYKSFNTYDDYLAAYAEAHNL